MAATQSFGARMRSCGVRTFDLARASAQVAHMRLRLDDEDHVRYVFCDWERDCGVRSNQEAQINARQAGTFRRTIDAAEREIQRASETGNIRLALAGGTTRKIPLAERGWSKLTARPGKTSGAAVRFDRMAQPERWTLTKHGDRVRNPTLRAYRTMQAMNERGHGRHVVVLFKLYGPRDPAADYLRFGDWAPLAHLTRAATEIGDRATKHLRREIAAGFAEAIPEDFQASWIAHRASVERAIVEPRHALDLHVRKIGPDERTALEETVESQSMVLLARASTAFYDTRAEIES